MPAVGFGLVVVGALLIYAGMTGESLTAAVAQVYAKGGATKAAPINPPAPPAPAGGGVNQSKV